MTVVVGFLIGWKLLSSILNLQVMISLLELLY
jgi:hypothetical protein